MNLSDASQPHETSDADERELDVLGRDDPEMDQCETDDDVGATDAELGLELVSVTRGTTPILEYDPALLGPNAPSAEVRAEEWRKVVLFFDPMLRWYFEVVRRWHDVADIVSHIWGRAITRLHRLDDPSRTWAYLVKIGRNRLLDRQKVGARERAREERYGREVLVEHTNDAADALSTELASEQPLVRGVSVATLRTAIAALSPQNQRLLVLFYEHGKSHAEIARELGLAAANTSVQRLAWIKRRLRERCRPAS